MSFASQIIKKDGGMIRLITAKEQDKPCWYLLELDEKRYVNYKRDMPKPETINVNNYGKILQSGWGEPPQELLEQYSG